VAAHHGSLAKELRLDAEQRLKRGELQVLVATASLELGIDIGDVDLVCQIASPGSIAAFLQRVGRSGHQVGGTPKGACSPPRDDLIECVALLDCVRRANWTPCTSPGRRWTCWPSRSSPKPATRPGTNRRAACLRQATPYAELDQHHYQALLRMLAEGYNGRQGVQRLPAPRRGQRHLRGRRGAS
jgi:ATP-dependent Lhr-like helicase